MIDAKNINSRVIGEYILFIAKELDRIYKQMSLISEEKDSKG